jgi:hypothetical protein
MSITRMWKGQTRRSLTDSWWSVAVIVLLTAALVYQRWDVTHPNRELPLKAGDRLPSIVLEDVDEHPFDLNWKADSRATLLYAFRPDCVWCSRNLAGVKALAAGTSRYRFLGISVSRKGLKDYLAHTQLNFPVLVAPDAGTTQRLRVSGTPQTILVSTDGTVRNVWFGAYGAQNKTALEKVFRLTLPRVDQD